MDNPEPIRDELFHLQRFEQHARSLAAAQPVTLKETHDTLLSDRLADNAACLLKIYRAIAKAVDDGHAITPAAVWLLDNYHLIERQVRKVKSDMPPGYYRQLPKLADGPFAGYPRVLGVVWAFVAHNDSRFEPGLLCRYVRAYQEVQPLTIGELWAVAITLRIVLIENLRRIAARIQASRDSRKEADDLADRLLGAGGRNAEPVEAALKVYANTPATDAFAVQLVHRLRDKDPAFSPALLWLDRRLAERGTTPEAVVHDEHQRQGTATVTVRNIITSMRLISDVDWTDLFERMSLVDDVLGGTATFKSMDFATRNLYRSAIEELARGAKRTELDVARQAMEAAKEAGERSEDVRRADPGYYLIAAGRNAFERTLAFRPSLRARVGHMYRSMGVVGYAALIALIEMMLLILPLMTLAAWGLDARAIVLLGVLGAIPAIDAAVALVNWAVLHIVPATLLPALDMDDGAPEDLRTLVVVPTLLLSLADVDEQIERLEIHYLSSHGGDVHFALLTDWRDAKTESVEGDAVLLTRARERIAQLNGRYGPAPGGARFLVLHRRRVWVESEQRWMGWERKRGKLHELNRLLRGAADTTFLTEGQPRTPAEVRYVITLDADTKLPRNTVTRLIGKMAHPLNRPRLDSRLGRVVEGYAIMQPRVTPSLPIGREGSLFQRIFSSMSGIDPYATAVSDIYQDLYGEGSYTGKGIYDVDAFEAALENRIPDSRLLSHDLFEGVFARAGLASDVEVVDDFPARYDVAASRHHRWARGDWQLLPWILDSSGVVGHVPPERRVLPEIGRWKMIDNLRRTLSAPAAIIGLLLGWALPFHAAAVWTIFVLASIVLPVFIPLITSFAPRRPGIAFRSHIRALAGDVRLAVMLVFLLVTFLAHQAWLMGDAILRTLGRLLVTHRNMLEWVPAAQVSAAKNPGLAGFYQRMGGAVVTGIVALAIGLSRQPEMWRIALPLALLWIASPAIAHYASETPADAGTPPVTAKDALSLRLIARRTWRFFEEFVTATDNMLPPDNFQEQPAPVVAHRTSPTNIGLYLLSVATAKDLGWIGTADAVDRMEATFATLKRLLRFRGHFYNWYDTRDLRPLDPQYISAVDSGNLAGHLIALANACREWRDQQAAVITRLAGLMDTIDLAYRETVLGRGEHRTETVTWKQFDESLARLTHLVRAAQQAGDAADQTFAGLAAQADIAADIARALSAEWRNGGDDMLFWAEAAKHTAESHLRDLSLLPDEQTTLAARLRKIEDTARTIALGMDFDFLFDEGRKLLSIGYLPGQGSLDSSCYDLLASEARLASFFAIAKGDIPARHWFLLGRAVTPIHTGAALISWSGSMFEYLMPSLVMRAPTGSLIERTNRLVVRRQIDYATKLGVPWGISESAYNIRDREFTYQYLCFGVPGLGFKRGLEENTVIAPYATALATMVDPAAAAKNFEKLAAVGALGQYGFYEALDYTPLRLPENSKVAVVRAFMAHHQGMSVVAIGNALLNGIMRNRFHSEPLIQATELLLQERTPREVAVFRPWESETASAVKIKDVEPTPYRHFSTPHTPTPATHLLCNGHYAVMLTAAGSGYSRWRDLAVTRWRDDSTCDNYGSYIYLRDVKTGQIWSAGHQPICTPADSYDVSFDEDHAEFQRRDGDLTTALEVVISPESNTEVRRISISNFGGETRDIDVTSYMELVLAPHASDLAHPAFSKLFVETTYLEGVGGIMATRRRRGPEEPEIWIAHLAVVTGESVPGAGSFETDRARFIGRNRDVSNPIAITDGLPLSNTAGTVLDPIFALRRRLRIQPGEITRVTFWTTAASSREELMEFVDKRHDAPVFERTATLAWTQARVQLHHVGIDPGEAAIFQRLASYLIYPAPAFRPSSEAIRRGSGAQTGLWAQGISGDLPIVLMRVADTEHMEMARQLVRAHEYWRTKQLAVDLVILNEKVSSYIQDFQVALEAMARVSQARTHEPYGQEGRIFVLRADLIAVETRTLLTSIARVVLSGQGGRLSEQFIRISDRIAAAGKPRTPAREIYDVVEPTPVPKLEFFNGLGGFAENGREYVTVLGPGQSTPAPWLNVIANPHFGFQVTADGTSTTWAVNSRENQLTPWSNDPVSDRAGEAFYLRDEDTGELWSPTAYPIRNAAATYVARHGRGYSRFQHIAYGIDSSLAQFVPLEDSVKISRLTLTNTTGRHRRIAVTAYAEWVLGRARSASVPFVSTEIDPTTGAMLARNPWNSEFGTRVSFADLNGAQTDWTGDRRAFIGRNGTLANPAALEVGALSKVVGAGLDPCAALRTIVTLAPDESVDVVFFLGQAGSAAEAQSLVTRCRRLDLDETLTRVTRYWNDFTRMVEVKTPDRALDIMLNGWLMYQTLVCRVWARSGFYQSSGAYGFRDQLQDGTSLASMRPDLTREHLLRAASRQFREGDVQHWWLPHSGQGVRTRISDDRPWLAYCAAQYISVTGDTGVLDERLHFLEGPPLTPGTHDHFYTPVQSTEAATLFEHCARALDQSLAVGAHGLPLIGTGDWNDGMNRVGEEGKGESVWLAWLLTSALTCFAAFAQARGEKERADRWRSHAESVRQAVESNAWDGDWYRRGYFDDGSPLGSATSDECRIDCIAQSWAVISGAGDRARASHAMAAADEHLVRPKDHVALLFAPPFNKTPHDPGYIKGYPPGIRENGGQYTHASLWSVIALAKLGHGDKAHALLSLLNPINQARTRADAFRYKVEPYIVAADIYAKPPHTGRGGWTWYTGSAGWMQRAGMENILGIQFRGTTLEIDPCIPAAWPGYEVRLQYRSARYEITVENPDGVQKGVAAAEIDGAPIERLAGERLAGDGTGPISIALADDARTHKIIVRMGRMERTAARPAKAASPS